MDGRANGGDVHDLRVASICSLTPLEELDAEPFLVDTRAQQAMCDRWAAEHGHTVVRQLQCYGLDPAHPALWADVEAGAVDLFVVPGERVLARAVTSVADFTAVCAARGVRWESAARPEPAYAAADKAGVHRRLSMPTAGYDGC
ncbi:hypothetical protein [Streptomyces sp. NPDC060194]|uniref:hypothetical protein n=1 Tax=Streptomyces sp. NPDC060194 TaxID=3347069 RepID=UPI00365A6431